MKIEIEDGTFCVEATLLGELLSVAPPLVPDLLRSNQITSACERGVDEHEGQFRLTFFYKNRRARVSIDAQGQVLRRSVLDRGERPAQAQTPLTTRPQTRSLRDGTGVPAEPAKRESGDATSSTEPNPELPPQL
jgi:hypothetical protein